MWFIVERSRASRPNEIGHHFDKRVISANWEDIVDSLYQAFLEAETLCTRIEYCRPRIHNIHLKKRFQRFSRRWCAESTGEASLRQRPTTRSRS
jgi:hypothetical protein